jgi:Holliday junction resolvase RusA-like endonuclease
MEGRAPDCRFVVPGAPTPLARQRHGIAYGRDGKPLLNKAGKPFVRNWMPTKSVEGEVNVKTFAYAAMQGRPPLRGAIELRMSIFVRIPQSWSQKKQRAALDGTIIPTSKPDASNILKLVEDGMRDVAIYDDKQIADLHIWRRFSDRPRVVCELYALEPQPSLLDGVEKVKINSPLVGTVRS